MKRTINMQSADEKMFKQYFVSLLLIAAALSTIMSACFPGGGSRGKLNCSHEEEVCVSLSPVKTVRMNERMPLQIKVTSTKDLSDLLFTISTDAYITVEGPENWEKEISKLTISPGMAYWFFSIKAGQTLTFNRVLQLPSREGNFNVNVFVLNFGRTIEAFESFTVHLSKFEGRVIFPGTPFPRLTPDITSEVYGPGTPRPTRNINPTNPYELTVRPRLTGTPSTTSISPRAATFTPQSSAYPALASKSSSGSPTPSSTLRGYPK